ncbi:hypothetical protein BLOT_007779 [Blomia tropicalis]|nr:hypothetical protein BLOT_007779 [Blomia tropicalis]
MTWAENITRYKAKSNELINGHLGQLVYLLIYVRLTSDNLSIDNDQCDRNKLFYTEDQLNVEATT